MLPTISLGRGFAMVGGTARALDSTSALSLAIVGIIHGFKSMQKVQLNVSEF